MSTNEQVRANNYPQDHSWIDFDPTTAGMANMQFKNAVVDHGNGEQLTWRSYVESDNEQFTVEKSGLSDVPPQETDGWQMHKWTLRFHERQRTLLIDMGSRAIERFEGEFTVPGSNLDVSDVIAACFNLRDYENERRDQGWDPHWDNLLRRNGLL